MVSVFWELLGEKLVERVEQTEARGEQPQLVLLDTLGQVVSKVNAVLESE